jgi:putative ABC transport system permease protein
MQPYLRAPVFATRLLLHERSRTLASIGGVAFALLLMLLQVGFRNALLDSALELMRRLDADVIVMSKEKKPFLRRDWMPRERLYQARSARGVVEVSPVWMALTTWTNLETRTLHPIRLIGFDPTKPTFLIDEVNQKAPMLRQLGTALVDDHSRTSYGPIGPGRAEVDRREIEVVGTFPLGTDFEVDGNLLVSEETFFDLTGFVFNLVEVGLVHVAPGADIDVAVYDLTRLLPTDVRAFTKEQLIARDRRYWETETPISVILLVGVTLGFAVGVVICYQILYTEVLDHLPQFATLKAMGYGDRFIQLAVVFEAWVLSILGFVPAIVVGWVVLALLGFMSGLPAGLGWGDVADILLLSVGMCTAASLLALRKVRVLDPAELF